MLTIKFINILPESRAESQIPLAGASCGSADTDQRRCANRATEVMIVVHLLTYGSLVETDPTRKQEMTGGRQTG